MTRQMPGQGDTPPSRHLGVRRPGRRRVSGLSVIIAIIGLLGASLLLYPSAAAWFTQARQSQEIDQYTDRIGELGQQRRADEIERAVDYNGTLVGGSSVVAAGERKPLSDVDPSSDIAYDQLLRADVQGLMARIKIPAIDVDLPIYHGTSDDVLEHGIGHLEGTALPVGGGSTHAVLTGHRGLATAELFTHLDELSIGDTFTIEVFGEVLSYQIAATRVVAPADTDTLYPQAGRALVTLVTCTPLGINSHRILVTGERILPTPVNDLTDAGRSPEIPGFPWWAVIFTAVLLAGGGYVILTRRRIDDDVAEG